MRAVLWTGYGPPEVLQPGELPIPEPKPGQVRIRQRASAVTYSDTFARALAIGQPFRTIARLIVGWNRPRKPVMGIVVSGEVDKVGAGVTAFTPGDAVFGMNPFGSGAYAQYLCMKAHKLLAAKPANLSFQEAAAIPYGGLLALHFLEQAGITAGMRVIVYGASGATGSSAVQLAKHFGALVTGVCSTPNVELVQSLGAARVIDYTREDFTALPDRYDIVFAAVGRRYGPPSREVFGSVLTPGGRFVTVDGWNPKMTRERLTELRDLASSGALRPVIDRVYPLEAVAEGHRYVETRRKRGNVIVDIP